MLQILLAILRIYLKITFIIVLCKTASLILDGSWKEDLESRLERVVFLVTTYLLILMWPAMLASCLHK